MSIIPITYKQSNIFKKFKESEMFSKKVEKLGMNKPTIIFKISLLKLIKKFSKFKKSTLSKPYFKKNFKQIKATCKRLGH